MPQRPTRRPLDWRGRPTKLAQTITEDCARAWGVAGIEGQREPYYVPVMPDGERRGEP